MNLQEIETKTAEAIQAAKGMYHRMHNAADGDGRALTPAEETAVNNALREAQLWKERSARARGDASITAEIGRQTSGIGAHRTSLTPGGGGQSLGAQIVNSEVYQWLKEHKGALPGHAWTSPSTELMATTITEDPASGGPLLIPDYRPGIVELPTRPLTVADLIAPGTTDSNSIIYMKETTFTNAAAPTAEAAAKPESTFVFSQVTDPVQKIAHWVPVTEEMLEDVSGFRSYIDARLRTGVDLAEDDQLLNGSGTPPALRGILNRSGLATPVARGADTNPDAILKQIAAINTATNLQPTGIVMHPTNWLTILLMKDSAGNYLVGGGPLAPPVRPRLWGLPVAVTTAIVLNTALVGAFRTASQVFRKGGLRVEASNSHNDYFIKNLVAIRAERREALAVYRPAAFGTVTGLV